MSTLKIIFKYVGLGALSIIVIFLLILFYLGFSARNKPTLQPWHKVPKLKDNLTQNEYIDFATYLAAEKKFLDDIYRDVQVTTATSYNRYERHNPSSPYINGDNLNTSFEFVPNKQEMQGGVLLVHGLTDSPYNLRAIGRFLADNGYYVIGLRLPGHGTVPGALLKVSWKDWYATVQFGTKMVLRKTENIPNSKFYVVGFSTGGALTLRYVLEACSKENIRVPDKLLLLSPAIGVTPFAEVTDWHKLISWIPFFEKFKWIHIKPEYDPFKYNSFPKNAADQVFDLTKANWKLIKNIAEDEIKREKLPSIYAFQSRVDNTVRTSKLIEMFAMIASDQSELLLFDVNLVFETAMDEKLKSDRQEELEQVRDTKANVMVVSNKEKVEGAGYERRVVINTLSCGKETESRSVKEIDSLTNIEWPASIFALSHVCIPISPDDRFYGRESLLGGISVKGEHNVLLVEDDLTRLRYNPFFDIIKMRLKVSFLDSVTSVGMMK